MQYPSEIGHRRSWNCQQFGVLVLLTGVAFALRWYRLGAWSFWIDEIFTLQAAQSLGHNLQTRPLFALTEFPLTAVAIRTALRFTGENEFGARLAVAIVGALSLPLLYVPMRQMVGRQTAVVAMIILAFSPWHLYWSQNARFYVLLLLLYALALFFFYIALEKDSLRLLLLSLLFFVLAATERLLALYFLPVVGIYLASFLILPTMPRPAGYNRRNLGLLFLLGVLGSVLPAWTFVTNPSLWGAIYFVAIDRGPFDIFLAHLRSIELPIFMMGIAGSWYGLAVGADKRPYLFLTISACGPLLITMFVSLFQFTHGRYTFLGSVSWFVLAAAAGVWLWQKVAGETAVWLAVAVLGTLFVLLPLAQTYDYFTQLHGGRYDWKTAFLQVAAQQEQPALFFTNDPVVGHYYTELDFGDMKRMDDRLRREQICDLETAVWFVIGGNSRMHPQMRQAATEWGSYIDAGTFDMKIYKIDPLHLPAHCR